VSLFHRKAIEDLRKDAERSPLRRALGPLALTALGIGSVIGTGIFVLTGTAASQNAGPALVISMIIAGVGCAFAGLCYAELASMIPVAGSAYTYAYATSGELVELTASFGVAAFPQSGDHSGTSSSRDHPSTTPQGSARSPVRASVSFGHVHLARLTSRCLAPTTPHVDISLV